jgi:phenylacetate-CoA ligase
MLSPGGKELIEGTFGCLVHSTYQAAETGRMGFQCERRAGFHLNVDFCAIRIVDGMGREVPAGHQGEIVASNLHNRATVLLNYRIGDWGTLGTDPCPCGRSLPLLERLEGRESEVIALPDGRVLPFGVVGTLFRRELDASLKAQIVQSASGDVVWRVVPFAGADRAVFHRALIARGQEVFGEGTPVRVEFVTDIPPTPAGKFARVVTTEDIRI